MSTSASCTYYNYYLDYIFQPKIDFTKKQLNPAWVDTIAHNMNTKSSKPTIMIPKIKNYLDIIW